LSDNIMVVVFRLHDRSGRHRSGGMVELRIGISIRMWRVRRGTIENKNCAFMDVHIIVTVIGIYVRLDDCQPLRDSLSEVHLKSLKIPSVSFPSRNPTFTN
jgi:hypothetical protein